jgi:hypothetical protein
MSKMAGTIDGRRRQLPVQDKEDTECHPKPQHRHAGRNDGQLQEAGRGADVAAEPRDDAAGLHVRQLVQRQVQQPPMQRPPERQRDPLVDDLLPVVAPVPRDLPGDDHRQEGCPRQMQLDEPICRRLCVHEQDPVDDVAHEKRVYHVERGH